MGQAKRRGTYEQRKAEAEERNRRIQADLEFIERHKPKPRNLALLIALTMAAQMTHNAELTGGASRRPG